MTSTSASSELRKAPAGSMAGAGQYLGLWIGAEEYAVGILRVREILPYEALTRVPGTPPSVRGVMNVRGSVVPVIDPAVKFGLPEVAVTNRTCVVIIEVKFEDRDAVVGVMADAVSQVVELGTDDILPPPQLTACATAPYLVGMGRSGRKFILVLDVDALLSPEELGDAGGAAAANADGCSRAASQDEGEPPAQP